MTLSVDFTNEYETLDDQFLQTVEGLLVHAAESLEIGDAEVSVMFVDDEKIRRINAEYRDKDVPTDVISFALEETDEGEVAVKGIEMDRVLGDIIVSIPRAEAQATEYGHSFERELGFLVVHGLLHLLGYDHQTKDQEQKMFALQEEILTDYGLKRNE